MKTENHFNRIGFDNNGFEPNLENLKLLQKLHHLSVPFENLDIPWKNPIILDSDK
ncbi:MAG: arylamine N-acetyltransferase, partial [Aridibacter sp.]